MNRNNDEDWLVLAVAHLTSLYRTQAQIQGELNLRAQSQVSNLLTKARAKNWIQVTVNFPPNLSEDDILTIKSLGFSRFSELRDRLRALANHRRGVVPDVHVVTAEVTTDRYTKFSGAAAQYLADQLARAPQEARCAVAWGRTVANAIEAIPPPKNPRPDFLFVPVSGEPMNFTDTGSSPTATAHKLAEKFRSIGRLSLRGVPARIPKDLADDAATIRRFIAKCHDYRRIFQEPTPLIETLDMLISGIGDAATSEKDPWFQEISELEGAEGANDLRTIAAGNIGGVWIPKASTTEPERQRLKEINSRWLGIQEEHLLACAKKATGTSKSPGVVVLAIEPEKAAIVHRAIGMVNRLVITRPLARALLELLDEPPQRA